MSMNRPQWLRYLSCTLALCLASTAAAQTRIPTENTLEDFQLFAPVDQSAYSDRPYLKEGLFFSHDFLTWSVQKPEAVPVGSPGLTKTVLDPDLLVPFIENNSLTTGEWQDLLTTGNRTEIGYMDDECCGWMLGHFSLHEHSQEFAHNNVAVIFEDPQGVFALDFLPSPRFPRDLDLDGDRVFGRFGEDLGTQRPFLFNFLFNSHPQPDDPAFTGAPQPLGIRPIGRPAHPAGSLSPLFTLPYDAIPESFPNGDVPDFGDLAPVASDFRSVTVRNSMDIWGAELSSIRRLQRMSWKGHWELFGGVRFLSVDEEFHFEGKAPTTLGDTQIFNEANNNIVGPQVGARFFKSCDRWTFSSEARLSPSVNFQAVRMRSSVASHNLDVGGAIPSLTFQNAGNDSFHSYQFSPIGELRLNLGYQLTRAISLKAGWTALFVDGLARPSTMVRYIVPNPRIIEDRNYSELFMQGVNVGIEINR